jgi:hypothetical protein
MKYQNLKDMPVKERPRKLLPAYSIEYFKGWYLIIFLSVLLLIVLNGTMAGVTQQNWWVILGVLIAAAGYLAVFVSICSGVTSSNIGTYFRETEPVRYWITNGITSFFVCLVCIAIWII